MVGHDAFGGFFLLNGGLSPEAEVGECLYLAPDSLAFERLKVGYSGFLQFCCQGDLEKFYSWARWPAWRQEVTSLEPDQGLSFYPFLWSKEGNDPAKTSRGAVPMSELWEVAMEARSQLDQLGPSPRVKIDWADRSTPSGDNQR